MPDFGDEMASKLEQKAQSFKQTLVSQLLMALRYGNKGRGRQPASRPDDDRPLAREAADNLGKAAARPGEPGIAADADGSEILTLDISDNAFLDAEAEAERYCRLLDDAGGAGRYTCELGPSSIGDDAAGQMLSIKWAKKDGDAMRRAVGSLESAQDDRALVSLGARDGTAHAIAQTTDAEAVREARAFAERCTAAMRDEGLHPEIADAPGGGFSLTCRDAGEIERAAAVMEREWNRRAADASPAQRRASQVLDRAHRKLDEVRRLREDPPTGVTPPGVGRTATEARGYVRNPEVIRRAGEVLGEDSAWAETMRERAAAAAPGAVPRPGRRPARAAAEQAADAFSRGRR